MNADHQLAELSRNDDGFWVVECSCGWREGESVWLSRQQYRALHWFSEHVSREAETRVIKR